MNETTLELGIKVARWLRKLSGLTKGSKAFLLFSLVAALPAPASAELIHGFAQQYLGAFDFEAQQTVDMHDLTADMSLVDIVEPPLGFWVWGLHGAGLVLMSGMTWESVVRAPADTSLYVREIKLFQDSTYVIRTGEGHYAKFRVLIPWGGYFEYVYQSDGSRVLDETVPARSVTWGQIKELFSERR